MKVIHRISCLNGKVPDQDVSAKEVENILLFRSNGPAIGYHRWPFQLSVTSVALSRGVRIRASF